MTDSVRYGALARSLACATLALAALAASAQPAEVRIGVIYDMTGPLATAGGYPAYLGTKYAIDTWSTPSAASRAA